MNAQTIFAFWRSALIASELLVVLFLVFVETLGRRENELTHSTPIGVFGLVASVAWFFLFLGSPFLVPSQKKLAVFGWLIAVTSLLITRFF